jgi:hypothetical protein
METTQLTWRYAKEKSISQICLIVRIHPMVKDNHGSSFGFDDEMVKNSDHRPGCS